MATLIEQVEAAMRLFGELEKRVDAIEDVVGREPKPKPKPNEQQPIKRATWTKRKILSPEEGRKMRQVVLALVREGNGKPVSAKAILRKSGARSVSALGHYLGDLQKDGLIRSVARGFWAASQARVPVVMDAIKALEQ